MWTNVTIGTRSKNICLQLSSFGNIFFNYFNFPLHSTSYPGIFKIFSLQLKVNFHTFVPNKLNYSSEKYGMVAKWSKYWAESLNFWKSRGFCFNQHESPDRLGFICSLLHWLMVGPSCFQMSVKTLNPPEKRLLLQ